MSGRRRSRILVIDDEAQVRDLWGDFLTMLGYDVVRAADGADGLTHVDRGGCDLILTDLRMPGLTGWDVAAAVRRRAPAAPVLVITGSATHLDAIRALAAGVTLLEKPVDLQDLKTAVEKALAQDDQIHAERRELPTERHQETPLKVAATLLPFRGAIRRFSGGFRG